MVLHHPFPQAMRAAGAEPFPAIMVDSKEEGKVSCVPVVEPMGRCLSWHVALGPSVPEPAEEDQEDMAERAIQEIGAGGEGGEGN